MNDRRIHRFPWGMNGNAQVWIANYGSKSMPLIAQLCRDIGLQCRILSAEEVPEVVRRARLLPKLFILSGGDQSVYDKDAPTIPYDTLEVIERHSAILGICYGAQLLAEVFGGKVRRSETPENGIVDVECVGGFGDYRGGRAVMNHGDEIAELPRGWETVASTSRCKNAIVGDLRTWAVQFHPEMDHTQFGDRVLRHMAYDLGDCTPDYRLEPDKFVQASADWMRECVPDGPLLCGVSGGVDSSTAFRIAERAFGDRLQGVYVNNGWCREGETEEVRSVFGDARVSYLDRSEAFYDALERIQYPMDGFGSDLVSEFRYYEAVRKTIGAKFIDVFVEHARSLGHRPAALIQGTNAADIIESDTGLKSHHNVTGLPAKLGFDILEPMAGLYKNEIRQVAAFLYLPKEIVHRPPFPGPGLALRTWGKLDRSLAPPLRRANRILEEVVCKHYPEGCGRPCQYYVALARLPSTGLMGDGRILGYALMVRMVWSHQRESYASLEVKTLTQEFLDEIATRLNSEVTMDDGTRFVRVYYELTGKPPSTTEPH